MPVIPLMYVVSAGDGIPHIPMIGCVVELSEDVLLYSGNMIIGQSAPLCVLKRVSQLTSSIEMLSDGFS